MTEQLDLLALNEEAFREKVLVGDGHSLYAPEHYKDVGFPEEFLPVEKHFSGESHKSSIFVDGKRVKSMDAVYHLELLHKICSELGLKYHDAMGRGFQAQNYVEAIRKKYKQLQTTRDFPGVTFVETTKEETTND